MKLRYKYSAENKHFLRNEIPLSVIALLQCGFNHIKMYFYIFRIYATYWYSYGFIIKGQPLFWLKEWFYVLMRKIGEDDWTWLYKELDSVGFCIMLRHEVADWNDRFVEGVRKNNCYWTDCCKWLVNDLASLTLG